ncbi:hypothetical protein ABI59_22910 [Acidobacteria bacterium Mor1]|nr:hypothetical protein ABI59_22910 [Acidobacteria bacterium Mor1]
MRPAFRLLISTVVGLALLTWGAELRAEGSAPAPPKVAALAVDAGSATRVTADGISFEGALVDLAGWWAPVRLGETPAGDVVGHAFVGQGRYRYESSDPVERSQARMFTGAPAIDLTFDRLLWIGPPPAGLESGPGKPEVPVREDLAGVLSAWKGSGERKRLTADAALTADLWAGPGAAQVPGFRLLWADTERFGWFFHVRDRRSDDAVRVGRFVPIDVDDVDEETIRQAIRWSERNLYGGGVDYEELGDLDIWSARPHDATESELPEPRHYRLEVEVDGNSKLNGMAEIQLAALAPGVRVVEFRLGRDLEVESVSTNGTDLRWRRKGSRLVVHLGNAAAPGEPKIQIRYAGYYFDPNGELDVFPLRGTTDWYPRTGRIDRATYDATFRWPKKYELLAGGEYVDGGEVRRQRWERRSLRHPASFYTFEFGRYVVAERQLEDLKIRFAIAHCKHHPLEAGVPEQSLETIAQAVELYENLFGDYPLNELTVATAHRNYSQGSLSFVTLSHFIFVPSQFVEDKARLLADRTFTISHEVAHQWWGGKLGWAGYRDQWLSEGIASYSAELFTYLRLGRNDEFRARSRAEAREAFLRFGKNGRPLESQGPIVLGARLNSSVADAYQSVVYDKGYLVLATLAQALGEAPLLAALRELIDAHLFEEIGSAQFLDELAQRTGRDLAALKAAFVYGTGVPEVVYDYEIRRDEDLWVVEGSAESWILNLDRTEVFRSASGGWGVRSRYVDRIDERPAILPVTYELNVDTEQGEARGLGGLMLEGTPAPFSIDSRYKPIHLNLDHDGRTLAVFHDQVKRPSSALRVRAGRLARLGKHTEAVALLERALEAPFTAGDRRNQGMENERAKVHAEAEYWRIHMDRAELELDRDDMAAATRALEAAQAIASPETRRTEVLSARMLVAKGDYREAYKILSEWLYLPMRQRFHHDRDLRYGVVGDAEAYALLAIAAHYKGREAERDRAIEEAGRRGAFGLDAVLAEAP